MRVKRERGMRYDTLSEASLFRDHVKCHVIIHSYFDGRNWADEDPLIIGVRKKIGPWK
jgi:hypothetical protein